MKYVLTALLALVPTIGVAANCTDYEGIKTRLAEKYGEQPLVTGISAQNVVQFFGNPVTGSWTIITVRPNKIACMVANGAGYIDETRKEDSDEL